MSDPTTDPKTQRKIDWAAIYAIYRTGLLSNTRLAKEYGISEGGIRRRAAKEKWVRDLQEEIVEELEQGTIHNSPVRAYGDAERASEIVRAETVAAVVSSAREAIERHVQLGSRLVSNAKSIADKVAQRLKSIKLTDKDLNYLANASWRATSAAQAAVAIERQALGLDAGLSDPNAPSSINITFYRGDKVEQISVGMQPRPAIQAHSIDAQEVASDG